MTAMDHYSKSSILQISLECSLALYPWSVGITQTHHDLDGHPPNIYLSPYSDCSRLKVTKSLVPLPLIDRYPGKSHISTEYGLCIAY